MKPLLNHKWLYFILICFCFLNARGEGNSNDTTDTNPVCGDNCDCLSKCAPIGVMYAHFNEPGKWTFAYSYMNMQMKGNRSGTGDVSDDVIFFTKNYLMAPNTMSMQTHMLMATYGLTDRLNIMAMFNYNLNSMTMNKMPADVFLEKTQMDINSMIMPTSMKSSGMGDTKIHLLYRLLDEDYYNIIIGGGINIPTGSTTVNGATMLGDNQRLPYLMQLGTGTWDLIPSITYCGQRNIISWGAEAAANIKPANNAQGYSCGNQYNATAWLSCKFINWASCSARIEGTSTDNMTGFDSQLYFLGYNDPTADANNFGGQRMNAYFGLNLYKDGCPAKGLRILVEYGIPVYQNLNGIQMSSKNIFQIGSQYSF